MEHGPNGLAFSEYLNLLKLKIEEISCENKSESNNTSEFISPPIFVGLGSNSAWPCAAN